MPLERYRIPGGDSLTLQLCVGDRLTLTDPEGKQPCQIAFEDESPVFVFLGTQNAGTVDSRLCERAGRYRLLAPGTDMPVESQKPPTEIIAGIERVACSSESLPPPLAEPRLDFRIRRTTAQAYVVRAGEYIQVIDVEGKQCSDFLAFCQASLNQGEERGLDATATRTVLGRAYPQPGLHSKFLDAQMRPLVEVVRDTVGRHDTFGFACTSKFYEDQGYPGHANCTDNFNAALAPFGIASRRGWAAINFFYNTEVDAGNALTFDEPWSRPGDYVLLRALTDLVCASSACPDDIDAANGWNPTDIHVRVYPETNSFAPGVAYRMNPDSVLELTKQTAFYPRTSALTRNFVEYKGYWLPNCFTQSGPIDEYFAARERAVVMDLSALRKFEIVGPDAEALLQVTLTRNVRRLAVGQVVYTSLCYETGGMIDDGTLLRFGPQSFRWISGTDYTGAWLREQALKRGMKVLIKNSTDQIHNLAVQGPASRDLLKSIIWTAPAQPRLEELKWFRFGMGRIGGAEGPAVVVSRTGYTGELGYEVWCHPKDGLVLWDAVMDAGKPVGLLPLGMEALDLLRVEAGLVFAGVDFCDQVNPFEAGVGFTVALDKEEDFIGKAALLRAKEHPSRALVGLWLEGGEKANHGDSVHVGRAQVGVITSGIRSPLLGASIALARLAIECTTPGTEVEIGKLDGQQKRLKARVVPFPFYDPQKLRPRS